MHRLSREVLECQVEHINAALRRRRSPCRVELGQRNGYYAVDQIDAKTGSCDTNLECGTIREIYSYLKGMLDGFLLNRRKK